VVSMVRVIINDISVRKNKFVINMIVIGAQSNFKDVMELLAHIFSKLDFDYINCTDPQVAMLGYYIHDLTRKKIFIERIPENTYILLDNPKNAIEEAARLGLDVVDLFVDAGSPLKHVYVVKNHPRQDGTYRVYVVGLGYAHENVYIYMELIPREEDGGEIHIEVGQGIGKKKRFLLERVLELSGHL